MNAKTLSPLFPAVVLAVGVAFGVPAHASLIDCNTLDPDISGKVTPSIGCQILEPLGGNVNDFTGGTDSSAWTVNTNSFFGYSDWLFDGKWEDPDEDGLNPLFNDGASLVAFDGDAQSGTWTLLNNNLWSLYSDLMFIFKDGANTNLTGYLMQVGAQNGTYESPFISPPFEFDREGARDISHISIYMRGNGVPVPAPGILGLLGIGLIGLGLFTRRRTTGS